MVASIGASFAGQSLSQVQSASSVKPQQPTQPSYAAQTQDQTALGGSGYTFTPAANISALSPNTAGALLSAQATHNGSTVATATQQVNALNNTQAQLLRQATAPEGNNPQATTSVHQSVNQQIHDDLQQLTTQQQQSNPAKPQYATTGINISV